MSKKSKYMVKVYGYINGTTVLDSRIETVVETTTRKAIIAARKSAIAWASSVKQAFIVATI